MKKNVESTVLKFSVIAFALVAAIQFIPSRTHAMLDTKQYVETTCTPSGGGSSWSCNNCNSGANSCNDNTCAQCKPAGGA